MDLGKYAATLIALVLSLAILAVCYPAFMSYDSMRMLEEARTAVRGGIYPTMPVYILRLFDVGGHGPTLMLMAENFLLLFSLALILKIVRARWYASVIALLVIIAMPTVIGCMLVLWKDVTTAAMMTFSIVIIFWAERNSRSHIYHLVKWLALLFLVVATLIRFNAITATAIVGLYWLTVFYADQNWKIRVLIFMSIIGVMGVSNKIVNSYTIPDFRRLETNNLAYGIMTYDLVGISKWSGTSLIPFRSIESNQLPMTSIVDIDKIYSPLGVLAMHENNAAIGNPVQIFPPKYQSSDIVRSWSNAIISNPLAYVQYRWDLFAEILGAKPYKTYEPTHFNRIDGNAFNITFQDRAITKYVLDYIDEASGEWVGKPWVLLLLSLLATIGVFCSKRIYPDLRRFAAYANVASFMYIGPFFVLSGTGEVRYVFPSLILSSIPILVLVFGRKTVEHTPRIASFTSI